MHYILPAPAVDRIPGITFDKVMPYNYYKLELYYPNWITD